jgi:hypothetical protein
MILKKQGEFVTEYFVFRNLCGLLRILLPKRKDCSLALFLVLPTKARILCLDSL